MVPDKDSALLPASSHLQDDKVGSSAVQSELRDEKNPDRDADTEMSKSSPSIAVVAVCIALWIIVSAIYGQTASFEFVSFDDGMYVYENPHVLGGLTKADLIWAFTATHGGNWHPLTSLSHMIDIELYGISPRGPHQNNLRIHAAAAVLLFLALRRLTGQLWASAFAAAVFAAHPLRVESVAWVSERKDVLSGLFFALILFVYAGYARRPTALGYALLLLATAFGLMAKPMLVTVPCLLLLLDFWPLGRTSRVPIGRLVFEKLPLFMLAAAASAATIWAQGAAINSIDRITPWARVSNAIVSYEVYIRQTFWPTGLAAIYPHPKDSLSTAEVAAALALVVAITTGTILLRRRSPYLIVGWCWYLGMLVPVIGLIQVGAQAHADRYTYLPQIGLVVALTWALADLTAKWKYQRQVLMPAALVLLGVMSICSWRQAANWRDSVALFSHTLACTQRNPLAHNGLGNAFEKKHRYAEAAEQFKQALTVAPSYEAAAINYAVVLYRLDRFNEAIAYFERGMGQQAGHAPAWLALGGCYYQLRRDEVANACIEKALQLDSSLAEAHFILGGLRARGHRFAEAAYHYRLALSLDPQVTAPFAYLGAALYRSGKPVEALNAFREALRAHPDSVVSLRSAAWIAATSEDSSARSSDEAIAWSEHADRVTGGTDPLILDALAAAYAEGARFADAVDAERRALQSAYAQDTNELKRRFWIHFVYYLCKMPLREPSSTLDWNY